MIFFRNFKEFKQTKDIFFRYCNHCKQLRYKVKIVNTVSKNHLVIQNMYICGLHFNKKLLQYHISWHYGIKQNRSVLLRIRLQKFSKTVFDNIYFKFLNFVLFYYILKQIMKILKNYIKLLDLLILTISKISLKCN